MINVVSLASKRFGELRHFKNLEEMSHVATFLRLPCNQETVDIRGLYPS